MNDGGASRVCGAGEVPLPVRHVSGGRAIQVHAQIKVAGSYVFEFVKAVHIAGGLLDLWTVGSGMRGNHFDHDLRGGQSGTCQDAAQDPAIEHHVHGYFGTTLGVNLNLAIS